jgi:inner membrane transporter RhtA
MAETRCRGNSFGMQILAVQNAILGPGSRRAGLNAGLARIAAGAPPESFFVGSAVFHYLGPAFAVLLFGLVAPVGVAWLRIVTAAAVFALWRRPWGAIATLDGSGRRTVVAMGAVLALMNVSFYISIDHLPLGTVAAIEFLPVIGLAAVGMRTARNALALATAVVGVSLLVDVRIDGERLGVAFSFANAALFAFYIVLAHRIAQGRDMSGIDGLGAAMLVAALFVTPIGASSAAPALLNPIALVAGVGVGVSSSVIPYVCDQLAMARLSRATYSLMVSLLPATATAIGIVVLAQIPSPTEVLGVALVVAAVGLHRERS